MLTLTGTYDIYRGTVQPQKITIKEDRILFWQYERVYGAIAEYKRITYTAPITQPLEWNFSTRLDTSGQKNYNWYAYIGGTGYYNYERSPRMCEVSFQTWDYKTLWYRVAYVPKKEDMVIIDQGIDLDQKSIGIFEKWIKTVTPLGIH